MASYILDSNRKEPSFDPFAKVKRRAVTFDLYGCLVNFRLIQHFVGQVARERKLKPDLAEDFFNLYYSRVMYGEQFKSYKQLLSRVLSYVDMEMDTNNVFIGCLEELYLMHADLRPTPDVMTALAALKRKNIELYLLANTDKYLAKQSLDVLSPFFDEEHLLTVDEARCYKPDIKFFNAANDKFKLRSADHFHVASNYFTDIASVKKIHWDTIYVNRRKTGVLTDCLPDMMIGSLTDLEDAMVAVRINQIEEEKAAQQREAEAAAKAESDAKAAKEAEQAARAAREAEAASKMAAYQEQQQQMLQSQRQFDDDMFGDYGIIDRNADVIGVFSGFTPLNMSNPQDAKIASKLKNMSPARARAVAAARERALAYAKARNNF